MSIPQPRQSGTRRAFVRVAERIAAATWDTRELKDPSGDLLGCTEDDTRREHVFWQHAEREGRWPGSRRETRDDAQMTLELLLQRLTWRDALSLAWLAALGAWEARRHA